MDSLRDKLQKLNALAGIPVSPRQHAPNAYVFQNSQQHLPATEDPREAQIPIDRLFFDKENWSKCSSLSEWIGKQTILDSCGNAVVARIELSTFWKYYPDVQTKWADCQAQQNPLINEKEDWTFLDIETAGPRGEWLFLVGLLRCIDGVWILEQYISPEYTSEGHLLELLARYWPTSGSMGTFNGGRFDLPCIEKRGQIYGIHIPRKFTHCDLLPLSRKKWKGQFPNCKLQTLEKYVLGRKRDGDIPGAEIPRAYHSYVENPEAGTAQMIDILYHNALDTLSLWELLTHLP